MLPLPAGRTEVNQGTLTIKNLCPADSGLYDCVATNTMGTWQCNVVQVCINRFSLEACLYGLLPV